MHHVKIRKATGSDVSTLRDIERAAGQRFRDFGLDHVADDEPASVGVLARYADDSRAWVAIDDADHPLGYILVDLIDDVGHIEQVSVDPGHQGSWDWTRPGRAG